MGIVSIRKMAQRLLAPVIIVIVLAMVVGMLYFGFPNMSDSPTSYKGKAVSLNGKLIKDREFQAYIERAEQQASQYAQQFGFSFTNDQIMNTALQMAINDIAIEQQMAAVEDQIKPTDDEAEAMIAEYLKTKEELNQFLESQGYANKKELIKILKEDIRMQKFLKLKADDFGITIPKEKIEEELEEITVSHILIGLTDQSGETTRTQTQALARAKEVYAKATAADSNFAELAKQYSDDPGSSQNGGTYGPMSVSQFKSSMVSQFVQGALALKEGEISQPVKTDYGYHVIRLDKQEMPAGDAYDEKYADAERILAITEAQQDPKFDEWLTQIRETAIKEAEILDPALLGNKLIGEEKWEEAAASYEKALKSKYYKQQWDLYITASRVYLELEQPAKAFEVLERVPEVNRENYQYQEALALAHKADNNLEQAEAIMAAYGERNAEDKVIHQQLEQLFTEWELTEAAAKEKAIVTELEKKEAADLAEYQRNLEEKAKQQETN